MNNDGDCHNTVSLCAHKLSSNQYLYDTMQYCKTVLYMPSIPFCFSMKFCQDNTVVTTPNTVTVATHSATKEAVVAVKTPEEGGTEINRDKLA